MTRRWARLARRTLTPPIRQTAGQRKWAQAAQKQRRSGNGCGSGEHSTPHKVRLGLLHVLINKLLCSTRETCGSRHCSRGLLLVRPRPRRSSHSSYPPHLAHLTHLPYCTPPAGNKTVICLYA